MKSTSFKFLYTLFCILLLGACAKDEMVYTGNIIGKVTDANSGEVLQGVTITITPSGASRTTGSDGYFEFRDLDPKQYEIQARKNGYTTNNKTVTVVTGRDASGDIQLTPIVQDGKLSLSVSSLNFGSQNSSLSFSIQNNGNKAFSWNISGLDKIDWLSITPTTGTLAAGKSNAVTVTLNRDRITEYKETTIIVNADKESMPLKITAEAENKTSKISLSDNVLNFGTEYSSLTFDIKNIGNAGNVNWNITGIDADWIKVTPTAGTTAMSKSSAVKVDVDRSKLDVGQHSTTILVNAEGESLKVTINIEKGAERYLEVTPSALALGTNDSGTLSIMSHNGSTVYKLYGNGDFSWASVSKSEGVIPEFNPNDASTIETITINVNRTGLAAGDYSFTLIIRSDLEDYTVPVTMTVEENQTSGGSDAEIISCNDDLVFTITSCKMSGTTATLSYMVENIGNSAISLSLDGYTSGRSYIYDDQGNQYNFDSNKASLTLGNNASYQRVSATIPAGVKVKGSVKIYNVSDLAAAFSNITIWSYSEQNYLIFKNVAIEGRSYKAVDEPQTTGTVTSCSDDLEFTLLDCKRSSSNTVTISYRVANVTNKAVSLSLDGYTSGRSYIYDNQGNQYNFDSNKASLTLGNNASYQRVSATIPGNVFTKGSVIIKDVDASATEMANVTIWSYSHQAYLTFQNVKIR